MGYYKGKRLSQRTIALLWIAEGGNPAKADEASAVAYAESNGYTKAGNYCCHGIYAFNVEVGVASMACAHNPVCATRKAISLSKDGTDWGPWEAQTNGSYKQYLGKSGVGNGSKFAKLNKSQLASLKIPGLNEGLLDMFGVDPGDAAGDVYKGVTGDFGTFFGGFANTIEDIGGFFIGLGELILTPEGWLRLAKIVGGSILLLWGLRIVTKETTGTDPVGAAQKAAGVAVGVKAAGAVAK